MSYTRGSTYIWSDDEHVHLWCESGMDDWPQMASYADNPAASGVQICHEIADEFAVMRVAELLATGTLAATVDRALAKWAGNLGCRALESQLDRLTGLSKR